MIKTIFLFVYIFSNLAFAGHETGNGGGIWVCEEENSERTIRWAQLVDLFEAENEFSYSLTDFKEKAYLDIIESIILRIKDIDPKLARLVSPHAKTIMNKWKFIKSELEVIDDSLYRVKPSTRSCLGGSVKYLQLANYTNYNKVLIDKFLFFDQSLSEADRAALIIHEILYLTLRKKLDDKNSIRARYIVGLLFSTNTNSFVREEIRKTIPLYDRPSASATSLGWFHSSPTSQSIVKAVWNASIDHDMRYQIIRIYRGRHCSIFEEESSDYVLYNIHSYEYRVKNKGTITYSIESINDAGVSSYSSCSAPIEIQ